MSHLVLALVLVAAAVLGYIFRAKEKAFFSKYTSKGSAALRLEESKAKIEAAKVEAAAQKDAAVAVHGTIDEIHKLV